VSEITTNTTTPRQVIIAMEILSPLILNPKTPQRQMQFEQQQQQLQQQHHYQHLDDTHTTKYNLFSDDENSGASSESSSIEVLPFVSVAVIVAEQVFHHKCCCHHHYHFIRLDKAPTRTTTPLEPSAAPATKYITTASVPTHSASP
jgi:CRISPR/Cas system endoribonuclease Cas6 (RAMP superfamily)